MTDWLECLDMKTFCIEPGSPWENDYNESFTGTLRYELLGVEWFGIFPEAKVPLEFWNIEYNTIRLHRSLGYRPPDLAAIQTWPNSSRRSLPINNRLKKNDILNLI